MYDELKPVIDQLIADFPKSYVPKIKKHHPDFIAWLNDQPYNSFGERLYNWRYVDCVKCCVVCSSTTHFKQFSHGYYEYCSCSCRAKHNQSYKNAHDVEGRSKGKNKLSVKSEASHKKRITTMIDRMGSDFRTKLSVDRAQRYVARIPDELKDYDYCSSTNTSLMSVSQSLSVPFSMVQKAFKKFNISPPKARSGTSLDEVELCSYIDSLGIPYVRNIKTLFGDRREIDIYIPSIKVGIEYCGLFWHSDRNNYDKNKHHKKWVDASKLGINLITVFEDEWLFNRDVVKSRLASILQTHSTRIFARKCQVTKVSHVSVKTALNNWHIAGAKSSSNSICLTHDGQLVSVLTYGTPRYNKNADIEIIRFASLPGVTVIGAFGKLLNELIKLTNCKSIVSYSDNRWGQGNVYRAVGFELDGITPPSYFYFKIKDKIRFHRSAFMKHHIIEKLHGDSNLSEYENMKKLKYNRIYDCGTTRWVLNIKKPA
jgi:hypothetical protein